MSVWWSNCYRSNCYRPITLTLDIYMDSFQFFYNPTTVWGGWLFGSVVRALVSLTGTTWSWVQFPAMAFEIFQLCFFVWWLLVKRPGYFTFIVLLLSCWCSVSLQHSALVGLQSVIMAFLCHTHLLFHVVRSSFFKHYILSINDQ